MRIIVAYFEFKEFIIVDQTTLLSFLNIFSLDILPAKMPILFLKLKNVDKSSVFSF